MRSWHVPPQKFTTIWLSYLGGLFKNTWSYCPARPIYSFVRFAREMWKHDTSVTCHLQLLRYKPQAFAKILLTVLSRNLTLGSICSSTSWNWKQTFLWPYRKLSLAPIDAPNTFFLKRRYILFQKIHWILWIELKSLTALHHNWLANR